jgi:hypothetical protein
LTGFNGRCDAIYFSSEETAPPEAAPLDWRMRQLGLSDRTIDGGRFDLVVIGGGYGGTAAAISAARMGVKVALIQNRPVLGGNGSSEVRVWAKGGIRRGLFPALGEIVEEFQDNAKMSPGTEVEFGDDLKERLVRAEPNIALFLNHHVYAVEKQGADSLGAVTAIDTRTSERKRFTAAFFVDATGHATVGALAGAELTLREKDHLGMSNMWRWKDTGAPVAFPATPWALSLEMEDFPYPKRFHAEWFWESGFNLHPLNDLELTRDWNLRAVFGAFNAMKNGSGAQEHRNADLEWVAYVGGTRESRQLLGDVVLTREDIASKKPFPDGTVPTTWDIDLHYPKEQYAKKFPENPFISKAVFEKSVDRQHGYPVPYRCFYSRNISNLFMAGRNVSVTHEALGTVRVMKTGGMIGEVVGKAASLCLKHQTTPRGVYERYLPELLEMLKLPGAARRTSLHADVTLPAGYKPLPPVKDGGAVHSNGTAASEIRGIVFDDAKAVFTGEWSKGAGLEFFVESGYRFRGPKAVGSATFTLAVPQAGKYEVRLANSPHENRATNMVAKLTNGGKEIVSKVNLRVPPPVDKKYISLGVHTLTPDLPATLVLGGDSLDGVAHADAVVLVPTP